MNDSIQSVTKHATTDKRQVDRAGAGTDRTDRTLRPVVLVDTNTTFRNNVRCCPFKAIELRGKLKDRVGVGGISV
ncbi:hypothetical protein [Crateriforma conspicua]|uniref:hypothetical protein n=1 Tax=Crateriforma conspicua TaxID=2527996 RepID=UPI0011A16EAC|nr:hypothetical protein [Crateriforma conspicua]